jgi:hypothetical protein
VQLEANTGSQEGGRRTWSKPSEELEIEVTKSCGKLDLKGEMMLWRHLDLQDVSLVATLGPP